MRQTTGEAQQAARLAIAMVAAEVESVQDVRAAGKTRGSGAGCAEPYWR
jgi:hypothetical protein